MMFSFLKNTGYYSDFLNYLDNNNYKYNIYESISKGYNEYIFIVENTDAKLIEFKKYIDIYI